MDAGTIITILTGAAGVAGGFVGGKRLGNNQAVDIAGSTVELFQASIEELRTQGEIKDAQLAELRSRVSVLESLVTQRAEVEVVYDEVKQVRGVVDRIASKVGA